MENPSVHASTQALLICEHCGASVKQGSCYNSMGTDPLILCNDCYAKVSRAWDAMAESMREMAVENATDEITSMVLSLAAK